MGASTTLDRIRSHALLMVVMEDIAMDITTMVGMAMCTVEDNHHGGNGHNHNGHNHHNGNRNGNGNGRKNGNGRGNGGNGSNRQNGQAPKDLSHIQCFKCKNMGHYATDCPESKPNGNGVVKPNPFNKVHVNHVNVEEVYEEPDA